MDIEWNRLIWPLTTLLGIVSFFTLFREPIHKLLAQVTSIELDPRTRKFKVRFGEQVKYARERAKGVEGQVAVSRSLPAANYVVELAEQSTRDVVLEAWGALKQVVYDACTAGKIPLTPATRMPEAVRRLAKANVINMEFASLLNILYELGQEIADDTSLRPVGEDALAYKGLAADAVDWFMLSLLSPRKREDPKPLPTVVARNFSRPKPGHPTVSLVGTGGPVQGRRFSIERELCRIGRDVDNDVRITGDEYVSGHHAALRYEHDNLFLYDQDSRNGTFLNEKRVKGTALVQRGDHIRLGGSTFQVLEAPIR